MSENTEVTKSEKKVPDEPQRIEIPKGSKFIMVFEKPGGPLSLQSGNFINIDEMLGFNRRAVNPQLTEQMIIQGAQQAQAQQQAENNVPPKAKVIKKS